MLLVEQRLPTTPLGNSHADHADTTRPRGVQVDATPVDLSHTEPVYDFAWLQSKTGTELMTLSTDGAVTWWDIRMFGEYTEKLAADKAAAADVVESLPLKEKGGEVLQGGVCFAYDPAVRLPSSPVILLLKQTVVAKRAACALRTTLRCVCFVDVLCVMGRDLLRVRPHSVHPIFWLRLECHAGLYLRRALSQALKR